MEIQSFKHRALLRGRIQMLIRNVRRFWIGAVGQFGSREADGVLLIAIRGKFGLIENMLRRRGGHGGRPN